MPKQTQSLYSSFIGVADKFALTEGAGLNVTPDGLRGMARMIAPTSTADPSRTAPMSIQVCEVFSDSALPLPFPEGRAGLTRVFLLP